MTELEIFSWVFFIKRWSMWVVSWICIAWSWRMCVWRLFLLYWEDSSATKNTDTVLPSVCFLHQYWFSNTVLKISNDVFFLMEVISIRIIQILFKGQKDSQTRHVPFWSPVFSFLMFPLSAKCPSKHLFHHRNPILH